MGIYLMAGSEPRLGRGTHAERPFMNGGRWTATIRSLRLALATVAGAALAALIFGAVALA